ncbi:HAMP domain-containing protein [Amorphus sp. 3PC139-8]
MVAVASYYYNTRDSRLESLIEPDALAALIELVETVSSDERALIVQAIDTRGLQVHFQSPRAIGSSTVAPSIVARYEAALKDYQFSIERRPADAVEVRFPAIFLGAINALQFRIRLSDGEVLVVDTRSPLLVSRIGLPIGFGAGMIGSVIALIALLIMHRETRPLKRLAAAADRMDLSGDPIELPQARSSAPEIRSLIDSFDRLQRRLSNLLRARMAMMGGISHDVRTFATRLRLRLEDLPEGPQRERAIADIADMIHLLDDALLSSRAGAGELSEQLVEFDELVVAEVDDRKATGAPIDLVIAPNAEGATVLGDRLALRRIVANLSDNALRYGFVAHLRLEVEGDQVALLVDDEGTGVPENLREVLLEPFVRMESSRSRLTGGAGLGLAVVVSLVGAHRGTLVIGDAPSGGARFAVRLPLFRARSGPDA